MPGEHQEVHLLFQMTLINQERFTVFGFPPSNIFFFFFHLSCRFSYGSYLIWFNVLNGTSSIILGSEPYNFRYYHFPNFEE